MGTRNAWTDKEIALLERLAREHVGRGGVVDEAFACGVVFHIPRHSDSGILRRLHRLGYRARMGAAPSEASSTSAPDGAPATKRLTDSIDRLIDALKDLKRSVTKPV